MTVSMRSPGRPAVGGVARADPDCGGRSRLRRPGSFGPRAGTWDHTGAIGLLRTDSLNMRSPTRLPRRFLVPSLPSSSPTGSRSPVCWPLTQGPIIPHATCDGRRPRLLVQHGVDCGRLVKRRKLPLVFVDQTRSPGYPASHRRPLWCPTGCAAPRRPRGTPHRHITENISGDAGSSTILSIPRRTTSSASSSDGSTHCTTQHQASCRAERHSTRARAVSCHTLLEADDRPTAILCFSDVIAYGCTGGNRTRPHRPDISPSSLRRQPARKAHAAGAHDGSPGFAAKGPLRQRPSPQRSPGHIRLDAPRPSSHVLLPTELIVPAALATPR